jgi:DNA-binding transcriptional LysR family regulator
MRTIDLEALKIFRTVVDEGGVVRAATNSIAFNPM